MKKILSLLAILMVAMTAWAIDPVKPNEGTGSDNNPYKIATAGNLVWFAQQVNSGYNSIYGKLIDDIDLGDDQTMIGRASQPFKGVFDGDGHTVTVNYTATEKHTGLFRELRGTVRNLKTAGNIKTEYEFSGGIAAYIYINAHIEKCSSSVTITYTNTTDNKHVYIGGIVGHSVGGYLTDVVFTGKLLGPKAYGSGGLIAWTQLNTTLTNCLFCPSEVTVDVQTSYTLVNSFAVINNCYYSVALGTVQGTATTADAIAKGETCYKLNGGQTDGTQGWYQNIDNGETVDATPVPFNTHGTVYGGETQCPAGTYSNTSKLHSFGAYDEEGISHCTRSGCSGLGYQPAVQDAAGTYLIANKGNLAWFARQVNAGKTSINGKLTADIDMGNDQSMIGTSGNKYSGTFDGDGHSVTVNYTTTEDVTALFRYVGTATIKNLMTTGTITTSGKQAAGVVGKAEKLALERVMSNVTISSSFSGDSSDAGLVAEISSTSTLTDCAFIGKLLGTNTSDCAGLIGWEENAGVIITNCYVNIAEQTVSTSGCKTFARYSETPPTISNCYYVTALGDAQGTLVEASVVTNGSLATALGNSVWNQDYILCTPVPFFLSTSLDKYLKFTAQGDGTITVKQEGTVTATLQYFTEGATAWTDVTYDTPISLAEGKSIWMCAKGVNGKNENLNSYRNHLTFTSSMDVAASQNTMSLLDATCQLMEVPENGFYNLFSNWSHLTQAPELPATILKGSCYNRMFYKCTSLTTIPDISHARLANNASGTCDYMFNGCSKLKVNTLGLGSEWKVGIEEAAEVRNANFYCMFVGTGGNFTDTPQKDVTYYIYDDEPYTRQMTNEWGTLVLPFDVAYDATNTNHKLYHLTAADSKSLTFAEYATGTIPAGTPMAVKAIGDQTDGKYTISIPSAKGKFSDAITEQNSTNASLPAGWTMTGTYSNLTGQTGIYFIAQGKFWYAEDAITIAPFRAWFTGPSFTGSAKAFDIIIDEDEVTRITPPNGNSNRNSKYLENGRVVIVKNGKKYNLNGQGIK